MSLPQPSEEVEVVTKGGITLAARMLPPDGDTLRLSWLEAPGAAGPATLNFGNRRGLLRISGLLDHDPKGVGLFRPDGPAELMQRREAVRVALIAPVSRSGGGSGQILDISVGGFLMTMPGPMLRGDVYRFHVQLPDRDEPLAVTGEIRRAMTDDRWGVQMRDLAAEEEERLVRLIFARQRLALQTTRDG
jgi:hypothetical protein